MIMVKIVKLGPVENPTHEPPAVERGERIGAWIGDPVVGKRFEIWPLAGVGPGLSTSPVRRIVDDNTFETHNSVYRWEKFSDDLPMVSVKKDDTK